MNNFNIKELFIHIFHGGIILCALIITAQNCDWARKFIESLTKDLSFLEITSALIISYLIGLFIDPLADSVETRLIARGCLIPPSYYLLKDGKRCNLILAHNAEIRNTLSDDAIKNNDLIDAEDSKPTKETDKEKIWKNQEDAMLLFNYAKQRAGNYGTTYQLNEIDDHFRLFIFYRNMIWSVSISLFILLFANELPCCRFSIISIGIPVAIIIFYHVSYKYHTYYCRAVLSAAYRTTEKR
jgi:hypothetical protein